MLPSGSARFGPRAPALADLLQVLAATCPQRSVAALGGIETHLANQSRRRTV